MADSTNGTKARNVATQAVSNQVTKTSTDSDARIIAALMFFTVAFSLVGNEIKGNNKTGGLITEPAKIVFGGTAATATLVLLSHAGDAGRQFAIGLAVVTFTTSALVYGAPVWRSISSIAGRPGAVARNSTPTTPSTPSRPTGVAAK
jgi:hypothetical protein